MQAAIDKLLPEVSNPIVKTTLWDHRHDPQACREYLTDTVGLDLETAKSVYWHVLRINDAEHDEPEVALTKIGQPHRFEGVISRSKGILPQSSPDCMVIHEDRGFYSIEWFYHFSSLNHPTFNGQLWHKVAKGILEYSRCILEAAEQRNAIAPWGRRHGSYHGHITGLRDAYLPFAMFMYLESNVSNFIEPFTDRPSLNKRVLATQIQQCNTFAEALKLTEAHEKRYGM